MAVFVGAKDGPHTHHVPQEMRQRASQRQVAMASSGRRIQERIRTRPSSTQQQQHHHHQQQQEVDTARKSLSHSGGGGSSSKGILFLLVGILLLTIVTWIFDASPPPPPPETTSPTSSGSMWLASQSTTRRDEPSRSDHDATTSASPSPTASLLKVSEEEKNDSQYPVESEIVAPEKEEEEEESARNGQSELEPLEETSKDESGDNDDEERPTCPDLSSRPCGLYIAPSSIPFGGMGTYTGVHRARDEMVFPPDLVIPVVDMPYHACNRHRQDSAEFLWVDYIWDYLVWTREAERRGVDRVSVVETMWASPGVGASVNHHNVLYNTYETSVYYDFDRTGKAVRQEDDDDELVDDDNDDDNKDDGKDDNDNNNDKVDFWDDPSSGAYTPYFNRYSAARRSIKQGSEIFTHYGDSYFSYRGIHHVPKNRDMKRMDALLGDLKSLLEKNGGNVTFNRRKLWVETNHTAATHPTKQMVPSPSRRRGRRLSSSSSSSTTSSSLSSSSISSSFSRPQSKPSSSGRASQETVAITYRDPPKGSPPRPDRSMLASLEKEKREHLLEDFWKVVRLILWEYGPSAAYNASPTTFGDAAQAMTQGTSTVLYKNQVQSLDWLEQHGVCVDHIHVGPTTISILPESTTPSSKQRGAFASRFFRKGSVVTTAPLLILPDRSLLDMYPFHYEEEEEMVQNRSYWEKFKRPRECHGRRPPGHPPGEVVTQQLLLNYALGHANSTVLLTPYGPVTGFINHAPTTSSWSKTTANVRLQWAPNGTLHHESHYLELSPSALAGLARPLVVLQYVATRDICAGDEILLDYGPEWQAAWDQHVRQWQRQRRRQQQHSFVGSAAQWNRENHTQILRTQDEQEVEPYPSHLLLTCLPFVRLRSNPQDVPQHAKDEYLEYADYDYQMDRKHHDTTGPPPLRPCRILNRTLQLLPNNKDQHKKDNETAVGVHTYTVSLLKSRLSTKERWRRIIVERVPRHAIVFSEKIYSRDFHNPQAFRHEMRIPNHVFPPAWINA